MMDSPQQKKKLVLCKVYHFSPAIDLPNIDRIHSCLRRRLLAVQKDGKVNFVRIGKHESCRLVFPPQEPSGETKNLLSFRFEDESPNTECIEARFVCINDLYEVCIGRVTYAEILLDAKEKLSKFIDNEFEKTETLYFQDRSIVLRNRNRLFLLTLREKQIKLLKCIQIAEEKTDAWVQVFSEHIVVFHPQKYLLEIFETASGLKFAEMHLDKHLFGREKLIAWSMKSDLNCLLTINDNLQVNIVWLESYSKKFPENCTVSGSGEIGDLHVGQYSESDSFRTTHIGDAQWRGALSSLYQSSGQKEKVLWYHRPSNAKARAKISKTSYKWNISGFRNKKQCPALPGDNKDVMTTVHLPASLQSMAISDVLMFGQKAVVVFSSQSQRVVCCVDALSPSHVRIEKFDGENYVVLSPDSSFPHMIISEKFLACLLMDTDTEQEELVTKMMVYAGAGIADTLCHINQWGRCSIPIHTLEVGLKQRQIDTVVFFLKSKENLFSPPGKALSGEQDVSPASPPLGPDYTKNLMQVVPAIDLITTIVEESLQEKNSVGFCQKICQIVMDFLHDLLHSGLDIRDELSQKSPLDGELQDVNLAIDKILDMIATVRKGMAEVSKVMNSPMGSNLQAPSLPAAGKEDDRVPSLPEEWSNLNKTELVEQGVLSNRLLMVQSHLRQQGHPHLAQMGAITECCLHIAFTSLAKHNISKATRLIANLGLDVDDQLWQMASFTSDQSTVNFIVKELEERGTLSPKQKETLALYDQINKSYPNHSFSRKLQFLMQNTEDRKGVEVILAEMQPKSRFDLGEECGDLGGNHGVSSSSSDDDDDDVPEGGYSETLLDWIQTWDDRTRQLVLLDIALKNKEPWEVEFDQELIVEYLLSHNHLDKLFTWLQRGKHKQNLPSLLFQNVVTHLKHCPQYIADRTRLFCARQGVYLYPEDFEEMLRDMMYGAGVLTSPLPLCGAPCPPPDQFHRQFIHYCVKHDLYQLLFQYCMTHKISTEDIVNFAKDADFKPWLTFLLSMYSVAVRPTCRTNMYEASLSNSALIWNLEEPLMESMLKRGETLTVLATLMYSPHAKEIASGSGYTTGLESTFPGLESTFPGLESIPSEELEKALLPYPKIHAAFFPTTRNENMKNDVTVYDLLKDNAHFDPRKLFGWQETNTLAGEDSPKAMPHFSQQDWAAKYGHTERITYTYYLKQGRPAFAFHSYLAELFEGDTTNISSKSFLPACGTALWIGIRNFHLAQVCCACVVFTEMLGHSSFLLRLYLQVGQEILMNLNSSLAGSIDKRKEQARKNEEYVVSKLCDCVVNPRRNARSLGVLLEEAIEASINRENIAETSFEAGQRWSISILFSHALHVPLSTKFLAACASQDKWLSFLWFAQLHQYPKEQLHSLLHHFKSYPLQQHIQYVVENAEAKAMKLLKENNSEENRSKSLGKDARSSLYAKIGLNKEQVALSEESSSEDEIPNIQVTPPSDDDEEWLHVDNASAPDDIFRVVFSAQASKSPWKSLLIHAVVLRNSLFAELSACYQQSQILQCLCGWLVSMMGEESHVSFLETHGRAVSKWHMRQLNAIIDVYVQHGWMCTLATGFDIMQPKSPLVPFFRFAGELTNRRDYAYCKTLLDDFKEAMHTYSNDLTQEEQEEIAGDNNWFQQIVFKTLDFLFHHMSSLYELWNLLKLLDSGSIFLVFSFDVPDYGKLSRMLQILVDIPFTGVSFGKMVSKNQVDYNTECQRVSEQLTAMKLFRKAKDFSREAGLGCEKIVMAEIMHEKNTLTGTALWSSSSCRHNFWLKCSNVFKENNVPAGEVSEFFMREAENVKSYTEKTLMYQLGLQQFEIKGENGVQNYQKVFHKMCHCRIRAKIEEIQHYMEDEEGLADALPPSLAPDTLDRRRELLTTGKLPEKGKTSKELNEEEIQALELLVKQMLDAGEITEANKLASEFSLFNQDIAIILTCIRLALGINQVGSVMDPGVAALLTDSSARRLSVVPPSPFLTKTTSRSALSRPISVSSFTTVSTTSWDFLPPDKERIVIAMETLINNCHHGTQTCKQILNCFVVAAVLDVSYEHVVKSDEFVILKGLLDTPLPQRFRIAADYLSSSSLPSSKLAKFLCDSIVEAYQQKERQAIDNDNTSLLFESSDDMFSSQFVTLCREPAVLGEQLLEVVVNLSDEPLETVTYNSLYMQTELLILAHTSYTVSYHMEGISKVLRECRKMTDILTATHNFPLMVRLLTGVGRFNEMRYIFDSLKQNDEFELLLKKGIEKENSLKIALLDYLKRFHPTDFDTYDMVAHNFLMYREIAKMLEHQAKNLLNSFKSRRVLENTDECHATLENIVQYFSDAAESYFKESCIRHAQVCIRQARLVALQLQHLSPLMKVIHLTQDEVRHFISTHSKFSEALIVSDAYNKKDSWPSALCQQVLIHGDFRYLNDLRMHVKINNSFLEETISCYQQVPNPPSTSLNNLKRLLEGHCKDIKLKYRIAQDFGLRDMVNALEKGENKCYIQDINSFITS